MHHREEHLTSNTATLANKILPNSQLHMRGLPERPFNFSDLNCSPDETLLYLYPHEEALELTQKTLLFTQQKFHLIVQTALGPRRAKFIEEKKEWKPFNV